MLRHVSWLRRRLGLPKRYRVRDFSARERFRDDYHALARHLLATVEFDSVYDLGCGNAFLLEVFGPAGKRIEGIESSPRVLDVLSPELKDAIEIDDFSRAGGRWDLVCCVEVAEHIVPERSEELVAKCCELAVRTVLFTAAPPGQTGHGHINCRPHQEWLGWFEQRGWSTDEIETEALRAFLSGLETTPWLATNSFLIRPRESEPTD